VLAAQRLGLVEVPVMTARGWTDEQKRAYLIADNKLTENGGWDQALLPGLPIALISVALKPVKSASKPIAARSALSTRACFVGDMAAALNNTDEQSGYRAAALLRQRMERCGVSRWHPDPVAACEAAEAEAKRVG
jgi:ParB-like chromosome segregation protein Spo0J